MPVNTANHLSQRQHGETLHFIRSVRIPSGVALGFSHVEVAPDDAAGRRVYSGISRSPPPFHSGVALFSPHFTLIGYQDLDDNSHPNFSTPLKTTTPHSMSEEDWSNYEEKIHKVFAIKTTYVSCTILARSSMAWKVFDAPAARNRNNFLAHIAHCRGKGIRRHVRNAGRHRSVHTVRLEEMIRQHINHMPSTRTRSIARQMAVSHSTVWDVLWRAFFARLCLALITGDCIFMSVTLVVEGRLLAFGCVIYPGACTCAHVPAIVFFCLIAVVFCLCTRVVDDGLPWARWGLHERWTANGAWRASVPLQSVSCCPFTSPLNPMTTRRRPAPPPTSRARHDGQQPMKYKIDLRKPDRCCRPSSNFGLEIIYILRHVVRQDAQNRVRLSDWLRERTLRVSSGQPEQGGGSCGRQDVTGTRRMGVGSAGLRETCNPPDGDEPPAAAAAAAAAAKLRGIAALSRRRTSISVVCASTFNKSCFSAARLRFVVAWERSKRQAPASLVKAALRTIERRMAHCHGRKKKRNAGMQGQGKLEIPEKTRRAVASSGMIPACGNPGMNRPGIEPGSPWWELEYSPPTYENLTRFPAGSLPGFRLWESCRKIPLVGSAVPYSPRFTLIGSQDLDVKGRRNLCTLPTLSSALKEIYKMSSISTNTCINPPLYGYLDALFNPWKIPDCFATRHKYVYGGSSHRPLGLHTQVPLNVPTNKSLVDSNPGSSGAGMGLPIITAAMKFHSNIIQPAGHTLMMDWPALTPDTNPIEHVWDELKRRARARNPVPSTIDELMTALSEEWDGITQDRDSDWLSPSNIKEMFQLVQFSKCLMETRAIQLLQTNATIVRLGVPRQIVKWPSVRMRRTQVTLRRSETRALAARSQIAAAERRRQGDARPGVGEIIRPRWASGEGSPGARGSRVDNESPGEDSRGEGVVHSSGTMTVGRSRRAPAAARKRKRERTRRVLGSGAANTAPDNSGSGLYTQSEENTARQFRDLRLVAMAHLMRLAVSSLSLPRFSSSNAGKKSPVFVLIITVDADITEPWWCSGYTTRLPSRRNGFDFRRGRSRIFARGNHAGRCRWSAGFLRDLPFPPPRALACRPCSVSPQFTLIGSQDLDDESFSDL
ncbi:hypothetical protein PR048_006942 [Dryococelus australis]|uniref:Tc1-like transposase DDE domain-containing protein n=1 Tax=Dryococelus australis TaxID=614101 RepID=A0ABQ9ICX6_9NEOP|nr:hypothetical protein PR048_006942 [Dryococelus australis]